MVHLFDPNANTVAQDAPSLKQNMRGQTARINRRVANQLANAMIPAVAKHSGKPPN
jgi:hypothetical protein